MTLPHITLATGHNTLHRLDTLDPVAVAACRALLPAGGPIPGFPAFRVEIHGPVFTVWRGREPIVTCGICHGDDDTHAALGTLQTVVTPPASYAIPAGAWLAIAIMPGILTLTQTDIGWLGDFERCMAAALITP